MPTAPQYYPLSAYNANTSQFPQPQYGPPTGGPTTYDPSAPVNGTGGIPAAGTPLGPYQTASGPATGGPTTFEPRFTGDAGAFLQSLYQARPGFVEQQGQLLRDMGPGLRDSIFSASPELAGAAQYFQNAFSDPFGGMRETHEDYIRSAQAARGFTGGGSGVVGEEARYLTNFAERRRQELLPQMIQFGQGILQTSGLGGPPDLTLGAIGALALQNRNQIDTKAANEEQSRQAQDMYNQYLAGQSPNPLSGGGGGGGGAYGGGGSFSFSSQGNAPGAGTPDFFSRQQAETEALLAARRAYAQGLSGNIDPNVGFFA